MSRAPGLLFLLFLIACDWAGDPYQGQSPLAQPFASQEVVCHSLTCWDGGHKEAEKQKVARVFLTSSSREAAAAPDLPPRPSIPVPLTGAERVYALKALRR